MKDYGDAIIDMMKIIRDEADDTIWLNYTSETVFERLWRLYMDTQNNDLRLIKEFPENA